MQFFCKLLNVVCTKIFEFKSSMKITAAKIQVIIMIVYLKNIFIFVKVTRKTSQEVFTPQNVS